MLTYEEFHRDFTLPDEYEIVNELPKVFLNNVDRRYIQANLLAPIKYGIDNNKFIFVSGNVWCYPITKVQSVYVVIDPYTKKGVGVVNVEAVTYCEEHYLYPKIVKKFITDYPALALELYKTIGKDTSYKIITDKLQSIDASSMWKKWYNNPDKYDIKQVGVIDIGAKDCQTDILDILDINKIWGTSDINKNILVWIKF
jgi:hypothetical protein